MHNDILMETPDARTFVLSKHRLGVVEPSPLGVGMLLLATLRTGQPDLFEYDVVLQRFTDGEAPTTLALDYDEMQRLLEAVKAMQEQYPHWHQEEQQPAG